MKGFIRLLALAFGPPLVCVGSLTVLFITLVGLAVPQLPAWAQGPVWGWMFGEAQAPGGVPGHGDTSPAGVGVGWSGYENQPQPPTGLPLADPVYLNCLFHDPNYPTHTGVDLPAPIGTPVYTTMAGEVVWVGWNGPWGNLVVVENGGYQVWFAHLSAITVALGQIVEQGDMVGNVGSTGNSTGPHLHYGIKQLTDTGNIWLNPVSFFGGADYIKIECEE